MSHRRGGEALPLVFLSTTPLVYFFNHSGLPRSYQSNMAAKIFDRNIQRSPAQLKMVFQDPNFLRVLGIQLTCNTETEISSSKKDERDKGLSKSRRTFSNSMQKSMTTQFFLVKLSSVTIHTTGNNL